MIDITIGAINNGMEIITSEKRHSVWRFTLRCAECGYYHGPFLHREGSQFPACRYCSKIGTRRGSGIIVRFTNITNKKKEARCVVHYSCCGIEEEVLYTTFAGRLNEAKNCPICHNRNSDKTMEIARAHSALKLRCEMTRDDHILPVVVSAILHASGI